MQVKAVAAAAPLTQTIAVVSTVERAAVPFRCGDTATSIHTRSDTANEAAPQQQMEW